MLISLGRNPRPFSLNLDPCRVVSAAKRDGVPSKLIAENGCRRREGEAIRRKIHVPCAIAVALDVS